MKLLTVPIMSKLSFKVHAEGRANKTLLGTSKTLGEIQRLCATP